MQETVFSAFLLHCSRVHIPSSGHYLTWATFAQLLKNVYPAIFPFSPTSSSSLFVSLLDHFQQHKKKNALSSHILRYKHIKNNKTKRNPLLSSLYFPELLFPAKLLKQVVCTRPPIPQSSSTLQSVPMCPHHWLQLFLPRSLIPFILPRLMDMSQNTS